MTSYECTARYGLATLSYVMDKVLHRIVGVAVLKVGCVILVEILYDMLGVGHNLKQQWNLLLKKR